MRLPMPLPRRNEGKEAQKFRYEGKDILTLEKLFERTYAIPNPQTSGEIISYYVQYIANELKLPSQFNLLAPKVKEFLQYVAFGTEVNLDTPDMLQAISRPVVRNVTMDVFLKLLRPKLIEKRTPVLESAGRPLSSIQPFPWAQTALICAKTVFN